MVLDLFTFVVAAIDFEVPASKSLLGLTQKVLVLNWGRAS